MDEGRPEYWDDLPGEEEQLNAFLQNVAERSDSPEAKRVMGMTVAMLSAGERSLTVECLGEALINLSIPISQDEWLMYARLAERWGAPDGWQQVENLVAGQRPT